MKKKIVSIVMTCILVFAVSVPAFALENNNGLAKTGQIARLVNTDDATASLNFSGTRANCSAIVDGKPGTSKITATALLKRVNSNGTTTVKTWTDLSANGESFYFDKSYYVASGYTYEFEIVAKVYRNGKAETIRVSDRDYCNG